MINTVKIETEYLPMRFSVTRWQYTLFGWNFLTVYRHRMKLKVKSRNYHEVLWIYIGTNFGFGIQLPWWGHYDVSDR